MLLDTLRDFEWLNEPHDVSFNDQGMVVVSKPKTDFWQSLNHNFKKDDGHFFFSRCNSDFSLVVKWQFETISDFNQCGIMVRIDERNWFKASIMSESKEKPLLGSCVTNCGYSDWAAQDISPEIKEIYFKVKRVNGDYIIFYSYDDILYKQIRLLHMINEIQDIKVGAYICSPQSFSFRATLEKIDLK